MSDSNKSIFVSKGWKNGMKYLYGWGAAVVIIGALFKILHFPGANEMLIVGLGTEAVIFFFSAFEPLPADEVHYQWDKVFPQLNFEVDEDELELDEIEGGTDTALNPFGMGGGSGMNMSTEAMEKMQETMTPELFESLEASVKGLKNNVDNFADIAEASIATNDFSDRVQEASGKISELTNGYSVTVDAMKSFSSSIDDVKAYQDQIQGITQNLTSLNAVYEMELQDAQKHLNSVNKFYGSISGVMENIVAASSDTDVLRQEVADLAGHMKSLNRIYGGMITAMTSSGGTKEA